MTTESDSGLDPDLSVLGERIRAAIEEVSTADVSLLERSLEQLQVPGWTASEYVFALGTAEAIIEHMAVYRRLQATLYAGAHRVGAG